MSGWDACTQDPHWIVRTIECHPSTMMAVQAMAMFGAIAAAIWLASSPTGFTRSHSMLLPDWIVLYMAIAGGAAFIVGARKLGVSLLLPAGLRWLIFPLLWPIFQHIPLALVFLAVPIVAIFGGLLILDRAVCLIYGPRAGGHVTGTYLVRIFDAIARGMMWSVAAPVRRIARLLRAQ
jgi:hypothetical protein